MVSGQPSSPAASESASTQTSRTYSFPMHRFTTRQSDPHRTPLVFVAGGSFSPITYLHLRMFEMAADFARFNTHFEVVGGYLSPVSDDYKKAGLVNAGHRLRMCEIAANNSSDWLMVDPWEALKPAYTPTAQVLDHFDYEINKVRGGIQDANGNRRPVRIVLLAGADLVQTMSTPGVWSDKDLNHILGRYGTFIVERGSTDIDDALANLQQWKGNIWVIKQLIQNDVSSTKIRLFLRREMSVRYLIPNPVIKYIELNDLYEEEGEKDGGSNGRRESTVNNAQDGKDESTEGKGEYGEDDSESKEAENTNDKDEAKNTNEKDEPPTNLAQGVKESHS